MGLSHDEGTVRSYNSFAIDVQKHARPELHSLVSRITETILAQAKNQGEPCEVVESTIGLKYIELCRHPLTKFIGTNASLPQLPNMSNSMTITIIGLTIRETNRIALTYELDPTGQALVSSFLDDLPGHGTGQKIISHADVVKIKETGDARILAQSLLNMNLRLRLGFTVQDLRILKFDAVGSEPFQMDPTGTIRPYTISSTTLYIQELNEVAFEAEVRHLFSQTCYCESCFDHHMGESRPPKAKMELLAAKFHLSVKNKNVSHHLRNQSGLVPQVKTELSKAVRNQENIFIQRDPRFANGYFQVAPETVDVDNIPVRNATAFNESLVKYPPNQRFISTLDSRGALANTMRFSQAPDRRKIEKEIQERSGARFYPSFQLSDIPQLDQTQGATFNTTNYLDSTIMNRSQDLGQPDCYVNIPDGRRLLLRDSLIGTVRNDVDETGFQRIIPQMSRRDPSVRDHHEEMDDRVSPSLSPTSRQILNNFVAKRDQLEEFINILQPINAVDQKRRNKILKQLVDITSGGNVVPGPMARQENVKQMPGQDLASGPRGPEVQFTEDRMDNMTISNRTATRADYDFSGNAEMNQLCQDKNNVRNQQQGILTNQNPQPRSLGKLKQLSSVTTGNVHEEAVARQESDQSDDTPPLANSTVYCSVLEETMDGAPANSGRVAEVTGFEMTGDQPSQIQPTVFTRPGREVYLASGMGTNIDAANLTANDSEVDGSIGKTTGLSAYDPNTDQAVTAHDPMAREEVTVVHRTNQIHDIMQGSSGNLVLREGPRVLTSHCNETDREQCQGSHGIDKTEVVDRVIPKDKGSGVSLNLQQGRLNETRGPGSDHELAQAMSHGQVLATRQYPANLSMMSSLPITSGYERQNLTASGMSSVPQSTRADIAEQLYQPASNISTINEEIMSDSQDDTNSRTLVADQSRQGARDRSARDRSARDRNTSGAQSAATLSSTTSDLDSERTQP